MNLRLVWSTEGDPGQSRLSLKNTTNLVAGDMTHWLTALAALPENLGSILSTHMAAHNSL